MWNANLEARAAEMRANAAAESKAAVSVVSPGKVSRISYPSKCPHCESQTIIRKGLGRNKQRYGCCSCGRTFGSYGPDRFDFNFMCYRCGGGDIQDRGPRQTGGRTGYCLACKRKFVQGGKGDLQFHHLLLRCRVDALPISSEFKAEMLQQAMLDVLEGRGYCWTVELDTKAAFKATRGEYGQQGSDHPMYRMHNGQSVTKDNA